MALYGDAVSQLLLSNELRAVGVSLSQALDPSAPPLAALGLQVPLRFAVELGSPANLSAIRDSLSDFTGLSPASIFDVYVCDL